MEKSELERRTKQFALRVARSAAALPRNTITSMTGHPAMKAGASVNANDREVKGAENHANHYHRNSLLDKGASESQDLWIFSRKPTSFDILS